MRSDLPAFSGPALDTAPGCLFIAADQLSVDGGWCEGEAAGKVEIPWLWVPLWMAAATFVDVLSKVPGGRAWCRVLGSVRLPVLRHHRTRWKRNRVARVVLAEFERKDRRNEGVILSPLTFRFPTVARQTVQRIESECPFAVAGLSEGSALLSASESRAPSRSWWNCWRRREVRM
jgi:hypothetical protein